jgi:hypothetical protein
MAHQPVRAGDPTPTAEGPVPAATPEAAIARLEGRIDELARSFDKRDALELVAAILLAIASVIAAWSAYQNARWGGEQAKATAASAALRTSAAQATSIAAAQMELDAQVFLAWLDHAAAGGTDAATVFADRMRPEFRTVFDAWLATAPPGQIPPGTPMDLPAYDETAVTADETAVQANELAAVATAKAGAANQTGDNFVLVAVIMATVLFFAGMGTRFGERRVRRVLVAWASVLLVGGVLFMLTQPVSFGI